MSSKPTGRRPIARWRRLIHRSREAEVPADYHLLDHAHHHAD
jgi:hypothetical protein